MPANFWLEDEEAYEARNKAITAGALVLMIANGQGAEKFRSDGSSEPQSRKVWLTEGGYASDTRHLQKLAEKQNQHRKLVGAQELRGFDVKPMIFAFGVGGTIYKQSVEDMRRLGVSSTAITKIVKEVHVHSVTCATNIITQRRILDSQKLLQTPTQPP